VFRVGFSTGPSAEGGSVPIRYEFRAVASGREVLDDRGLVVATIADGLWHVGTSEYEISLRVASGFRMRDATTGREIVHPKVTGPWVLSDGQVLKAHTSFRPIARKKMKFRLSCAEGDVVTAEWAEVPGEGRNQLRGKATVHRPEYVIDRVAVVCCVFWKLETASRGQRPLFLRPERDQAPNQE
jgi:hypothetical protein